MIHQFIFAGPKPGLAGDAFTSYWINFHAVDYAAKIPQIRQYLVAARELVETTRDMPWFYQGVAEIWLKDEAEQLAAVQSPEYVEGARRDEPRWAAFWRTFVLETDAQVFADHCGDVPTPEFVKLYVLLKRKASISLDAFHEALRDDRAGLAKRVGLDRHLVGFSRAALYGFGEPPFDAIEVLAVRDRAALDALLVDRSFKEALTRRAYVHENYAFNFIAREHWIIRPGER